MKIIYRNKRIREILIHASDRITSMALGCGIQKKGLMSFMFHGVSSIKNSAESEVVLPAMTLKLEDYRRIFEYFLEANYTFVSAKMMYEGLPINGRYIHVTFDDGYFNNVLILPLLKEYGIPVDIFVTTSNVLSNKKFWWDIVYQRMHMAGKNQVEIAASIEALKKRDHLEIVDYLVEAYGTAAFNPDSEADRPLAPDELKALADHPLVTIGNHTRDHIIMDRSSPELVLEQVTGAQQDLKNIIGDEPVLFAFPNGNYNDASITLLENIGFKLGFSIDFRSNHVIKDLMGEKRLRLGRYFFFSSLDVEQQCRMFRAANLSPIVVAKRFRMMMNRTTR